MAYDVCPELDAKAITDNFDAVTFARGSAYVQTGHVLRCDVGPDGHEITGLVAGSRRDPYHVSLSIEHPRSRRDVSIFGNCSCPIGGDCKHVVALALAAVSGRQTGTASARRTQHDPRVDMWLADIAEVQLPVEPSPEFIAYFLSPNPYDRQLEIRLTTARRKRDGTLSTKPYNPEAAAQGQMRALTADDVHVAAILNMAKRLGARFKPDFLETALDLVLRTERAFWDGPELPLRRVAPVAAELVWWAREDGLQQLDAIVHGAHVRIFCTSRPWAVLADGSVAPLEFDRNPRLMAEILQAPPIGDADAEIVTAHLAPLGVPAPATSVEVGVVTAPPVVQLALERGKKVKYEWEHGAVDGAFARLTFAYGERRITVDSREREWRETAPGAVTIVRRDDVSEHAAIAAVVEAGLRPYRPAWDASGAGLFVAVRPSPQFWTAFLLDTVPALRAAGWLVDVAGDFPVRVVTTDEPWEATLTGAVEVTLDLALAVDGKRVPLVPLLARALAGGKVPVHGDRAIVGPLDDGSMVSLPAERLNRLVGLLVDVFDRPDSALERVAIPLVRAITFDGVGGLSLAGEAAARVRSAAASLRDGTARPLAPPRGLRAMLRPYQREGYSWLQRLRDAGFGGVLADSMGLGKTVQTIAHLLRERASGRLTLPALVVAPTSLLPNWETELRRFGPSLRTLVFHGARRAEKHGEIERVDVVVTSYALLARDVEVLAAREWSVVILDEAQNVKNPAAKVAKAARRLSAEQRLCLTGTPVENHLDELWSLFAFVDPAILGDRERFRRYFRTPIEKHADDERRIALAGRIAPFLLRRTKEQVASDLPDKTEIVTQVELGEQQRDLYEALRAAMSKRVRDALASRGLARSHIVVLDALLKLRQACCDPRLLPSETARGVRESAKLDALLEMIEEMVDDGRRILLFSQFTSMLRLIEERLGTLNIPYVQLTGQTKDRATPVQRFQSGEVPLFLISLKAGGTGLNLTAADTVIHYDPWWNPAVEHQATDRAHRIGQTKRVFVYKLICTDTIEERIRDMQEHKGAIAQALLDDAATTVPLGAEEIARLFE